MPENGALVVKEVIEILKKLPEDAKVQTEGCDCIGDCFGVFYDPSDHTVLMSRQSNPD